ncbi:MAG: DUF4215 domain-containing protein [Deltaproteobacteria bacterium]|nr:DUF4215 domain-containing protein [Deltaproteobacteria bacterium]
MNRLIIVCVLVLAIGCGNSTAVDTDDTNGTDGTRVCVSGELQHCPCAGGLPDGVQACNPTLDGWQECKCDTAYGNTPDTSSDTGTVADSVIDSDTIHQSDSATSGNSDSDVNTESDSSDMTDSATTGNRDTDTEYETDSDTYRDTPVDTNFYSDMFCGDGIFNSLTEECDDGNQLSSDGCGFNCEIEEFYECTIDVNPNVCTLRFICGNGIIEPGEVCDDANTNADDGCNETCTSQSAGFECEEGEPCVETYVCGNLIVESGEACEDGNDVDHDGCTECQLDSGYRCTIPGGACAPLPGCGDGIIHVDKGERCDDGNTVSNDGCAADCGTIEEGYECITPGSACTLLATACGDGKLDWNEACDDHNFKDGDGCSGSCEIETGYICPYQGGLCIADCGDEIVTGGEECDDGNDDMSDDCHECRFTDPDQCVFKVENGVVTDECEIFECGDGVVNPNEWCDNGDANHNRAYGGCTTTCQLGPRCGDGIWQEGYEDCDNGLNINAYGLAGDDPCGRNCQLPPYCGDKKVQSAFGEACDDGVQNSGAYNGCNPDCTLAPFCGDGVINRGEERCDPAADMRDVDDHVIYACIDCLAAPRCGDGIVQREWGEDCDGAAIGQRECSDKCRFVGQCGDGNVDVGEQCDYGTELNDGAYGGCTPGCRFAPSCGDGVVQSSEGEECDLGDVQTTGLYGGCTADCTYGPHCGNGVIETHYEDCDGGDGCRADCVWL